MRADEIRPGDVMPGHYRVLRLLPREGDLVLVLVAFDADGGRDIRRWLADDETPLVRPEPGEEE